MTVFDALRVIEKDTKIIIFDILEVHFRGSVRTIDDGYKWDHLKYCEIDFIKPDNDMLIIKLR